MSIFEVWIACLQFQLYEHVIIFVICKAETVAFQLFSVCHATITEIYLRSFFKLILCSSLDDEVILLWHILDNCIPHILRFFIIKWKITRSRCFGNFTLFCTSQMSGNSVSNSLGPLRPKNFLLDEQVKVIVTFKST